MRSIILIVAGFLLATAPAAAAPLQQDGARADEPRGERWNDRWRGRQHYLYDGMAQDAATDGHAANAQANCRNVPVRVKRSDGTTTVRRINRCD
jgi:hypothetical protein